MAEQQADGAEPAQPTPDDGGGSETVREAPAEGRAGLRHTSRDAPTTAMPDAPSEAPTTVAPRPEPEPAREPVREPVRTAPRGPGVGHAVRTVTNGLATALRVVGFLCAAVLVLFILLRFVGVNPQNGVAQTVGALADALVLDFRDLFLIPDPMVQLVVNYGLAAIFWMVLGTVAASLVRFLGRLVP